MIKEITAAQWFRMTAYACAELSAESENINQLNVFPVPDGDTGTNMRMTMEGLNAAAEQAPDVSTCAAAIGAGMLRCARGNSGVILSVYFRGLAKGLNGVVTATTADLCRAQTEAVSAAYGAVMNPTEGTILTVMRETAEGAQAYVAAGGEDVNEMWDAMIRHAHAALERTPELLPMLKKAGVVDAGGYGFEIILRAMQASLLGEEKNFSMDAFRRSAPAAQTTSMSAAAASDSEIVYPYCTECIIEKAPEYRGEGTVAALQSFVLQAGDSAVFVDDEEIVKIHVHTSDPGSVLSEAIRYGALLTVKIENMRVQHSELATQEVVKKIVPGKYSFVSVANGDGICAAFRDLGVDELVMGGQTMNPSTEQMLEAIGRTDGEYVFVLPNNSNIILVAQQAAKLLDGERCVRVLPTKSVPQGVSALYAFDPEASLEDNTAAMTEAMGGVCTLSMTKAVRDADIDGLHIRQGQVLGMINGKVEVVSNTLYSALEQLLDPLLHASCVTVFCGEDLDDDEASEITALLRGALQEDTDLTVMEGGQPVYSLIIGGE